MAGLSFDQGIEGAEVINKNLASINNSGIVPSHLTFSGGEHDLRLMKAGTKRSRQISPDGPNSDERIIGTPPTEDRPFLLRLYVAGAQIRSRQAIDAAQQLCQRLRACRLEICDIYKDPAVAKRDNIIAVPTLLRLKPPPRLTLIGNLADPFQVAVRLGARA